MSGNLNPPVRLTEREPEAWRSGLYVRVSTPTASDDDEPSEEDGGEEILAKLRAYGDMKASRNNLIREADAHQIEEALIARLMGHSRTTIRSVLGKR